MSFLKKMIPRKKTKPVVPSSSSSLNLTSHHTVPHKLGALPEIIDIKDVSLVSDLVILVLGATGSGKSTIINLNAGRELIPINPELMSSSSEFTVVRLQVQRGNVCFIEVPESKFIRFSHLYQRFNVIGVIFIHKVIDGEIRNPLRLDFDEIKEAQKKDPFLATQLICVTTHWSTAQYNDPGDLESERLFMASDKGWGTEARSRKVEVRRFALDNDQEVRTLLDEFLEREQGSAEILWKECDDGEVCASYAYKIIVVMGDTRTGKSNFIAKVCNEPEDEESAKSLRSMTPNMQARKVHIDGHKYILVDTPGFNDTTRPDTVILRIIADWLEKTFKHKVLLDGILYFHRISDNRMTGSALTNIQTFRAITGKGLVATNVRFVTTMWDEAEEAKNPQKRLGVYEGHEVQLKEDYWKDIVADGATLERFNNQHESAKRILKSFREEWQEKHALQLQKELVAEGQRLKQTTAGATLYDRLCEILHALEAVDSTEAKDATSEVVNNDRREGLEAELTKLRIELDKLRLGARDKFDRLLRKRFWSLLR